MQKALNLKMGQLCKLLILSVVVCAAPASADELTLQEAVISALATDERIAAARSNLRGAEEGRVAARSYYKPRISAVGTFGYNNIDQFNSSGSLQRDGKKMYGGLEVQQDLWTFGRNKAYVNKADAEINIAGYELTGTQHEVVLDTINAFLDTRAAIETLKAYKDHVANLKSLLRSTEAKHKLSLVTTTELALVSSRNQQALAQLSMAEASYETRRRDLIRLIHEDFTGLENAANGLTFDLPKSADIAIESALTNSPIYLKARDEMAVAKANLDVARSARYPALTATGRWVKGRVGDLPTGDKEVGLSMKLPLYDGGMQSAKVRQAKHDLGRARHAKDSMERFTEQNARSAFITLNSARHVSSSWASALEAEEKSLSGIEREVEANLEGLPYLLEAKDKMMMVRIQAIETKKKARLAEFELLTTTGDILPAFLSNNLGQ